MSGKRNISEAEGICKYNEASYYLNSAKKNIESIKAKYSTLGKAIHTNELDRPIRKYIRQNNNFSKEDYIPSKLFAKVKQHAKHDVVRTYEPKSAQRTNHVIGLFKAQADILNYSSIAYILSINLFTQRFFWRLYPTCKSRYDIISCICHYLRIRSITSMQVLAMPAIVTVH